MRFDVLGPLRVVDADGAQVNLTSVAQRRLVSLFVCRVGAVVSADSLAEKLELSAGALRTSVSRLRRVVGFDVLVTAAPGYALRTENLDSRRFEQLVAGASATADPGEARAALEEALALWRGEAYGEFAHEDWAAAESRRLAELRAGAIEDLAERLIETGGWSAAIATVQPLIDAEPFRDRPRGLLMRALAGCGRRTDALRAFQGYRAFLLDEVGTEPSDAVVALDREIAHGRGTDVTLPSGRVTFLFTDIEGSTRQWVADPDGMSVSLRHHDAIVRETIESCGGYVFSTAGDSFAAAFERVDDAVDAATATQRALDGVDWRTGPHLRVRMGLHTGVVDERGGSYYGPVVNIAARVTDAGHGGQVLATEVALAAADIEGIDLGEHRLRDVETPLRLLQVGIGDFPPLRITSVGMRSIPSPRTSLVGRETALAEVRKLVAAHQLVTLTGEGGCGKTRLAIEVAAHEAPGRPDGVWFVDLGPVTDGTAVPDALAATLDLEPRPSSSTADRLATYLEKRDALLVIDNCEHLLEDTAALVDLLLERAPRLRILTTSRQPLELYGEYTWRVPSLELGPHSPSVRLFVDRAAATVGSFDPDRPTTEVIAEICAALGGNPRAIELASTRVRAMGVVEIRDHLDDRFQLLSGSRRRSREPRHTLEATVQWSYDLLTPEEQTMLTRLAAFPGDFDFADVATVTDSSGTSAVTLLDALVAKSMIDVSRNGERVRYRVSETIRLFAQRRG